MPEAGIYSELEQASRRYPDNIALQMFSEEGDLRFTHRETHELARQFSHSLYERGIGKGDRIALWARLSPKWVIAYLGALRAGVVNVPLDIDYGKPELAAVLGQIDCKLILTVGEKLPLLRAVIAGMKNPPRIVLLDQPVQDEGILHIDDLFIPREQYLPPAEVSDEDVATIFFTSGTTGKPKGVVIPHRSVTNSVRGLMQYLEVSATDTALGVIPSHHIFASLANILVPLAQGGGVTYPRNINSTELMNAMKRAKITVFPAVPQVFYLLHKKIFDEIGAKPLSVRMVFKFLLGACGFVRRVTGLNPGRKVFSRVHEIFGGHLRLLVSAASYFDPEIIRDFYSLGFTVQQGYALTETFGGGTFTPHDDNVIGSVGKPIPGIEIKLIDQDESGVGEVTISGKSVMQGYLNDSQATAEVLKDGRFHTGDLGSVDGHGNYYIRGRKKEMIVLSSGKKVFPEEVEQHYLQIPHIKEICVQGITGGGDYSGSERLHAVIVPDFDYLKQQRIVNSREIIREGIEQFSAYLPKYKRILSYEFRTEPLPRTASRKIQRFLVKPLESNGSPAARESTLSSYRFQKGDDLLEATEASRQVLDIIRRESGVDQAVHLDMNLELDLGFDSLQRIELLAQIEQSLGVRLGDDVASQTFTVRDLLATIERKLGEGAGLANGSPAPARITWKEIIARAKTDEWAERYIIEPSVFARVVHYLTLRFIYVLAKILFRLSVSGLDHLPRNRPFIICPNHQSYLDGPLVSAVIPYRVLKYMFTLGFTPFFSGGFKDTVARIGRIVPVDADTNLGRAMSISAIGLKAGQNALIFPEGGLSCDGRLQTFKKGAAILAKELNVPIVPVAIEGSFDAWSKVGDGLKLKPISITFGAPIYPDSRPQTMGEPEKEYESIALRIRDAISQMLDHEQEKSQKNINVRLEP